jgi:hypothetical protein
MNGFRRHLSYSNVVATLALVFAMGGSAVAAKHYLITSTSQISPKVLKALRGTSGAEGAPGKDGTSGKDGPAGAAGATGKEGPTGKEGAQGKEGPAGKEGTSGGTSVLSAAEQKALQALLPYVKYVASGVDGKPTIQFSGANVQIVNGEGASTKVNGSGNLILGYDETPGPQTGSHNLMLGTGQSYTSYGSVLGGQKNTASGASSVVFGFEDNASGELSSVLGGGKNTASFKEASVTGGYRNEATGENDSVTGGYANKALGVYTSVTGGEKNEASGEYSSVSGGKANKAQAKYSAILGTKEKTLAAITEFGVWPEAP